MADGSSCSIVRVPSPHDLVPYNPTAAARKKFAAAAWADGTRREYNRAWAAFEAWCATRHASALPASPETIADWIAEMGAGIGYKRPLARSTINTCLSAVLMRHRLAGHPIDRKAPQIAHVWKGVSNEIAKTRAVRKAKPVMDGDLRDVLDHLKRLAKTRSPKKCDRPILAVRDRALLAVGWAGALRRSEIVCLDWQKLGTGRGFVEVDERGVKITLMTSKTSQAQAVEIVIPRADMPTASNALDAWAESAALRPGEPVFRPVDQHENIKDSRLSAAAVSEIVKARVAKLVLLRGGTKEDAAERVKQFSGHSLRAGYVTTAASKGFTSYRIRHHTRHKSVEVVEGYIREAEKWIDGGLKGVGF